VVQLIAREPQSAYETTVFNPSEASAFKGNITLGSGGHLKTASGIASFTELC